MQCPKNPVRACLLGLAAAAMAMTVGANAASAATAAGMAGHAASAPAIPAGAEWAAWIDRDIEIPLHDLPQAYSCDALWYKLHAILLAIGAREYMSIMTYDCGKGAANGGRAPTIDLHFLTLRPVTGKDIRWANTRAIHKTVEIAPGEPTRLDAGDCDLVEQLDGTLFAFLGMKADASRFDCAAPRSGHDFSLSVRILERWPNELASSGGSRQ